MVFKFSRDFHFDYPAQLGLYTSLPLLEPSKIIFFLAFNTITSSTIQGRPFCPFSGEQLLLQDYNEAIRLGYKPTN
jgi:hypothetical protein